jgi:hypothetical protein
VFEDCSTEEQHSAVLSFVGERPNTKNIHKEMFPIYGGKCLSRKAVHNWVEKFSQGCSKLADDETEVRNWLRSQKTSMLQVSTHW